MADEPLDFLGDVVASASEDAAQVRALAAASVARIAGGGAGPTPTFSFGTGGGLDLTDNGSVVTDVTGLTLGMRLFSSVGGKDAPSSAGVAAAQGAGASAGGGAGAASAAAAASTGAAAAASSAAQASAAVASAAAASSAAAAAPASASPAPSPRAVTSPGPNGLPFSPSTRVKLTGTGWDHAGSTLAGAGTSTGEDGTAMESVLGGEEGGGGAGGEGGEGEEEEEVDAAGYYDEQSLPAHACSYCGIHSPASVIKCMATGKWFCNGGIGSPSADRGLGGDGGPSGAGGDAPAAQSRSGSHIIQHLVRSRHKEVATHPESMLGDTTLECYSCGCRNVFLLGFIPSKSDSVVVLLCREPCLTMGALKDQGWDLAMWEPLIQDRAFLPWLVPPPSEQECARARYVTPANISALEILWRTAPSASYADLVRAEAEGKGPESDIDPVQLKYDDGYHYQNVFGPLVKLEANEDKALKASMKATGVSVRWARNSHKAWTARFVFHRASDSEIKLNPGDEMCLRLPSFASQFAELDKLVASSRAGASAAEDEGAWSAKGFVVGEIRDGEVVLEISDSTGEITERMPSSGYTVEVVWRSVTFDRMQNALKKFAVDETSVTGYLYHALLGHSVEPQTLQAMLPTSYSAPGLPELNPSQMDAVRTVLLRPLSLIQGPPGTGKTVTSATIVYHLCKLNPADGQVLVAAPSNVAVDHLTEKIAATGLKVVRVMARSREGGPSMVEPLCLHSIVAAAAPPGGELKRLLTLRKDHADLSPKDLRVLRKLNKEAEKVVLAAADVICVTCAGAGDGIFADMHFRHVLIDEATQAAEPECLIPIVQGCKQLILVGDRACIAAAAAAAPFFSPTAQHM